MEAWPVKPPAICIVGKSKSGRMKLMEAMIKELKSRGLRVGVLKHHKHGNFEIDIEGKDTWRYAKAGANTVAISSYMKLAMIKNVEEEIGIDEICEKYFMGNDIVLAEGFTLSDKPRIILADSQEEVEIFKRECTIIAVVGKAGPGFYDVSTLADKVMRCTQSCF